MDTVATYMNQEDVQLMARTVQTGRVIISSKYAEATKERFQEMAKEKVQRSSQDIPRH